MIFITTDSMLPGRIGAIEDCSELDNTQTVCVLGGKLNLEKFPWMGLSPPELAGNTDSQFPCYWSYCTVSPSLLLHSVTAYHFAVVEIPSPHKNGTVLLGAKCFVLIAPPKWCIRKMCTPSEELLGTCRLALSFTRAKAACGIERSAKKPVVNHHCCYVIICLPRLKILSVSAAVLFVWPHHPCVCLWQYPGKVISEQWLRL